MKTRGATAVVMAKINTKTIDQLNAVVRISIYYFNEDAVYIAYRGVPAVTIRKTDNRNLCRVTNHLEQTEYDAGIGDTLNPGMSN